MCRLPWLIFLHRKWRHPNLRSLYQMIRSYSGSCHLVSELWLLIQVLSYPNLFLCILSRFVFLSLFCYLRSCLRLVSFLFGSCCVLVFCPCSVICFLICVLLRSCLCLCFVLILVLVTFLFLSCFLFLFDFVSKKNLFEFCFKLNKKLLKFWKKKRERKWVFDLWTRNWGS